MYNNIGATWLSASLFEAPDVEKKSNLDSAKIYCGKAVSIYENWLNKFGSLSEEDILKIVSSYYDKPDTLLKAKNKDKIIRKRTSDIVDAQIETLRRLSVAYTNLGIISRHNLFYDAAVQYYKKALSLWDDNLTAKNNLNILLGREREERSAIEKLFPDTK